jgi:hypothetical protein
MTNAESAKRLLEMLQRNCIMSTRQACRDDINLAAARAELQRWEELAEPTGIPNPRYKVDQAFDAVTRSTITATEDKQLLQWVTEKICGMIPEG